MNNKDMGPAHFMDAIIKKNVVYIKEKVANNIKCALVYSYTQGILCTDVNINNIRECVCNYWYHITLFSQLFVQILCCFHFDFIRKTV